MADITKLFKFYYNEIILNKMVPCLNDKNDPYIYMNYSTPDNVYYGHNYDDVYFITSSLM
jgi:hypothetical protein